MKKQTNKRLIIICLIVVSCVAITVWFFYAISGSSNVRSSGKSEPLDDSVAQLVQSEMGLSILDLTECQNAGIINNRDATVVAVFYAELSDVNEISARILHAGYTQLSIPYDSWTIYGIDWFMTDKASILYQFEHADGRSAVLAKEDGRVRLLLKRQYVLMRASQTVRNSLKRL